jgi:epoxyqueuosine reductase
MESTAPLNASSPELAHPLASADWKTSFVQAALASGFAAVGFTEATRAPHADAFETWIANGCHGEMKWLERTPERRSDPRNVLPNVQTIIALATSYTQDEDSLPPGRVASYALNLDYHDLLEPKLRLLETHLTALGGIQRSYVDTGPILERDFAAKAGLGWQGKSTMLISQKLGAFFFLSTILTTVRIQPDQPAKHRCGSCTRCIDACPTGAITAPYTLDARRCIAYLTIELKGSIPEELRPLIGDRIYGCDDCAAVCPWNRFAAASTESAFARRNALKPNRLSDYLSLDDASFRSAFKDSPIKRIKRRGFLRNVCVALGNVGTQDDLEALSAAAADPEPLIAEHAAWAITQINHRHKNA